MVNKIDSRIQIAEARRIQRLLATCDRDERDAMLLAIAKQLEHDAQLLFAANQIDVDAATRDQLPIPLRKRLVFDSQKLEASCIQIREVAVLDDPLRIVAERRVLDEGLLLQRISVPIGVIGMVFESRPDALIQIVCLCLKSGNAIVLKGGREALATNRALIDSIRRALMPFAAGSGWIVHLESREDVNAMLVMDDLIDLMIPRGSNEFVRHIMDSTRIPVLGHADGLCAIYVDSKVDLEMAVSVITDSKCQYPAVCNAVETLLIHEDIASRLLPDVKKSLDRYTVVMHGEEKVSKIIGSIAATSRDWDTEYQNYEIAIKVVSSISEPIDQITMHGSGHTDCILTKDEAMATRFLTAIDSADVFWNCSTRFSDGYRYGLGAEVGISTQKIHARGPVGLSGLTTSKWLLTGQGHIVATYSGENAKPFIHKNVPVKGIMR